MQCYCLPPEPRGTWGESQFGLHPIWATLLQNFSSNAKTFSLFISNGWSSVPLTQPASIVIRIYSNLYAFGMKYLKNIRNYLYVVSDFSFQLANLKLVRKLIWIVISRGPVFYMDGLDYWLNYSLNRPTKNRIFDYKTRFRSSKWTSIISHQKWRYCGETATAHESLALDVEVKSLITVA